MNQAISAVTTDASRFTIGFDRRDRARVHEMWDDIITSQKWSEGVYTERFETAWSAWNGVASVAMSSWGGGALAALDFIGIKGETVLCPSNTFAATPLSVIKAGGHVQFVDCNREDLCLSFDDLVRKADQHKPKAVWLVHIGGHIAFDIERIAAFCRDRKVWLLEDCAHAHGASWSGRKPGTWGDAGVYSFYATKTVSTGEGGMLVTRHEELAAYAKKYRNYGKFEYVVHGLNFRPSEFTSALGLVATERMEEIVRWKNAYAREALDPRHPGRLELPEGMISGLYKYVVFDPIETSTGRVYDQPCHRIFKQAVDLPNTDWVAEHHWCVPLYYHGGNEERTQN